MRGVRNPGVATLVLVALATASGVARAEECSNNFDSTVEAIQKVIFESRGCTIRLK